MYIILLHRYGLVYRYLPLNGIKNCLTHAYFQVGIFAHPIFSEKGGFPEVVQKVVDANSKREGRKESRLPYFTEEERKELVGWFIKTPIKY